MTVAVVSRSAWGTDDRGQGLKGQVTMAGSQGTPGGQVTRAGVSGSARGTGDRGGGLGERLGVG